MMFKKIVAVDRLGLTKQAEDEINKLSATHVIFPLQIQRIWKKQSKE
jgi:hypothetical protein